MAFTLSSNAYYEQFEQISTKEGLNSQEITALDNYSDQCLWVGTDIGINTISNGNITFFSSIEVNGVVQTIGRVNDIACYSYTTSLIASENFLLEFNTGENVFTPILYEGKEIIATSICVLKDDAYFFDARTNSLLKYSFLTRKVNSVYQFDKEDKFTYLNILKPTQLNDRLLLIYDNGLFEMNVLGNRIKKISIFDHPIVSKASYVDSFNNLWLAYKDGRVESFSIDSDYKSTAIYNVHETKLNGEEITSIIEVSYGDICVGTNGGGVFFIRLQSGSIDQTPDPHFNITNTMCLIGNCVIVGTPNYGLIIAKHSAIGIVNGQETNGVFVNKRIRCTYEDSDGKYEWGNMQV